MSLSSCFFQSNGINIAIASLATVLALTTGLKSSSSTVLLHQIPRHASTEVRPVTNSVGQKVLVDAGGWPVALRTFSRIASGSFLADPILWHLSSAQHIVAYSERNFTGSQAQHYLGKQTIANNQSIESILALAPDLLVLNSLGQGNRIAQLRSAGITVFDLGPMHGLQTFLRNVEQLGWLIGQPERGRVFAKRFRSRLARVSRVSNPSLRPSAIYVGYHAGHLYGGTRGTSYHDVLRSAGLHDAAAAEHEGWPAYSPENLLLLNPQYIVTQAPMRQALCEHPALKHLQACQSAVGVIEINPDLLSDPGVGMLLAAEAIAEQLASNQLTLQEPPQ